MLQQCPRAACASGSTGARWIATRAQCRWRRAAVRACRARRFVLRLRPSGAARPATTSSFRAARCGASRPPQPLDALLIEATNASYVAAGQGPARRPCDLRSGDARHADAWMPRSVAQQSDDRAWQVEVKRRNAISIDHLSVQSARCVGLARRSVGRAHQRASDIRPLDEPSLSPAAVGAHDVSRQPLRRLHVRAAAVRDRSGRDQGAVLPQQRRLRRSDLLSRGRFLQPRQHPSRHDDVASRAASRTGRTRRR